jgi:hypothetical protein
MHRPTLFLVVRGRLDAPPPRFYPLGPSPVPLKPNFRGWHVLATSQILYTLLLRGILSPLLTQTSAHARTIFGPLLLTDISQFTGSTESDDTMTLHNRGRACDALLLMQVLEPLNVAPSGSWSG